MLRHENVGYSRANNGTTPLHIAVKKNLMPLIRFFVEEIKVNINEAKDHENGKYTPLNISLSNGYYDVAEYLIL